MKIKAKAKLKGALIKVKAMFKNQMAGIEEAEKKGNKPDYIAHIIAKYNGRTIYEVSTGGFISKNPLFKFEFKGAKKGEKFTLTATDNNGKSTTKKVKIK
jgi:sulfur-oxidizing protein SoxZ